MPSVLPIPSAQHMESIGRRSTKSSATNIFTMTDDELKERLEFRKEVGFGNWGSVWSCYDSTRQRVAVKLVHRSKTPTTVARVKSLWNEMKIHRNFKGETHPSIIRFHSFIITPSYALITMDYLPRLIPVEVEEEKAKTWFASLLSGVHFLHQHRVSHNDIKPANILLTASLTPVIVDFGFAERSSTTSTLSYGTPEYLSPERAKGTPHDTRLSDVWSLGITFFEILIGRTPFERDGEVFETTSDLEVYWARSKKGMWLGEEEWDGRMSRGLKCLLARMIDPVVEGRCSAAEALRDGYWTGMAVDPPTPPGLVERKIKTKSKSKPDLKEPAKKKTTKKENAPSTSKTEEAVKAKAKLRKAHSATLAKASVVPEPPYSPIRMDDHEEDPIAKIDTQIRTPAPGTPKPPAIRMSTKPIGAQSSASFSIHSLAPAIVSPKSPRSAIPVPKRRPWPVYVRERDESDKENARNSDRENSKWSEKENAKWPGRKTQVRKPIPSLVREEETTTSRDLPAMWMEKEKREGGIVRVDRDPSTCQGTGATGSTPTPTSKPATGSMPKSALDVVKEMKASLRAAKMRGEEHLSAQDVSLSMELSDLIADVADEPVDVEEGPSVRRGGRDSVLASIGVRSSIRLSVDKLGSTVRHSARQSGVSILDTYVSPPTEVDLNSPNTANSTDEHDSWIRDVNRVVEETRSTFHQRESSAASLSMRLPTLPSRIVQPSPSKLALRQVRVEPVVLVDSPEGRRRRATVHCSTPPVATHGEIEDVKTSSLGRSVSARCGAQSPIAANLEEELMKADKAEPAPQRLSSLIDAADFAAHLTRLQQDELGRSSHLGASSTTVPAATTLLSHADSSASFATSTMTDARRKSRSSVMLFDRPTGPRPSDRSTSTRPPLEKDYDQLLMKTPGVARAGKGYASERTTIERRSSSFEKFHRRSIFSKSKPNAPSSFANGGGVAKSFEGLGDRARSGVTKSQSANGLLSPSAFKDVTNNGNESVTGRMKKAFQSILLTPRRPRTTTTAR